MQDLEFGRAAEAPRAYDIAAIGLADVGPAHAQHEQKHRENKADKNSQHDVDRDRHQRDEQADTEIKRNGAALRRARRE